MPGSIVGTSTVNLLTTRGRPPGPAQQIEDITRPGVGGHEGRKRGLRAQPGTVQVTATASSWSDAQAAADALEALQGEIVTLTDSAGAAHPNLRLDQVAIDRIQKVTHLTGTTDDHIVRATLSVTDVRSSA